MLNAYGRPRWRSGCRCRHGSQPRRPTLWPQSPWVMQPRPRRRRRAPAGHALPRQLREGGGMTPRARQAWRVRRQARQLLANVQDLPGMWPADRSWGRLVVGPAKGQLEWQLRQYRRAQTRRQGHLGRQALRHQFLKLRPLACPAVRRTQCPSRHSRSGQRPGSGAEQP